jgi:hypothetical protein
MSTERYPRKAVIAAPDGLTPQLKTKSRARRERQRTLVGIADHAPKRRNDLLPSLAVSYVPIEELRQAPRRVRRAEAAQIARVRASVEKFGVCQPVLIGKDRTTVHGHGVVEAARAAGLTEIPVIFVEHLSPAELRLLSIALNRTGETGQWDEEALRLEFAELIDLGEDVVVSGFEAAEIDFLLLDDESDDGEVRSRSRSDGQSRLAARGPLGPGSPPTSAGRRSRPGELRTADAVGRTGAPRAD